MELENLNSYFEQNVFELGEEEIEYYNSKDNGSINNVLNKFHDESFGVFVFEEKNNVSYQLVYINGANELAGYSLRILLSIELSQRVTIIMEYCKLLSSKFENLDRIEVYNTFQGYARTAFEKLGYFTLGNEMNDLPEGSIVFRPQGYKGYLRFPTLNKLEVYRWFFREDSNPSKKGIKVKKVYLLLDSHSNLIKIGQSFYPKVREKTLQGTNPKWDIITAWIAPVSEEKRLHKLFSSKRIRGEWFDLTFNDLSIIKKEMKEFESFDIEG